jgi:hypothetical protein
MASAGAATAQTSKKEQPEVVFYGPECAEREFED